MGEVQIDCKEYISSLRQNKTPHRILKGSKQINELHRKTIKEFVWSKVKKLTHD